jgi:hypothetical protein
MSPTFAAGVSVFVTAYLLVGAGSWLTLFMIWPIDRNAEERWRNRGCVRNCLDAVAVLASLVIGIIIWPIASYSAGRICHERMMEAQDRRESAAGEQEEESAPLSSVPRTPGK